MTASKATAASELEAMGLENLATDFRQADFDGRQYNAILAELRRREERERRMISAAKAIASCRKVKTDPAVVIEFNAALDAYGH